MSGLNMKLVNRGDTAEIYLIGRLDVLAATEAEKALLGAAERFRNITLDLAELSYVSSAGLRAIKRLYVTMMKKGGECKVVNIPQPIMNVFEVTGFINLL